MDGRVEGNLLFNALKNFLGLLNFNIFYYNILILFINLIFRNFIMKRTHNPLLIDQLENDHKKLLISSLGYSNKKNRV